MLKFLKCSSLSRTAWLVVALTALFLELVALLSQHLIGLEPCVMCIYERCVLFCIIVAGLFGIISPKTTFLRYSAIIFWLYSAGKGIEITWKHIKMQFHTLPFLACNFHVYFPDWLPLNKWFPKIFSASTICSTHQQRILTLEMQKWLLGIFIIYFIIAFLVLIAQLLYPNHYFFLSRK